jgi:hypothetical protein
VEERSYGLVCGTTHQLGGGDKEKEKNKNINNSAQSGSRQDLNLGHPEYKAAVLLTISQCSAS